MNHGKNIINTAHAVEGARRDSRNCNEKNKVELFTASKNIKRAPFSTSGTFWSELDFSSLYIYGNTSGNMYNDVDSRKKWPTWNQ